MHAYSSLGIEFGDRGHWHCLAFIEDEPASVGPGCGSVESYVFTV